MFKKASPTWLCREQGCRLQAVKPARRAAAREPSSCSRTRRIHADMLRNLGKSGLLRHLCLINVCTEIKLVSLWSRGRQSVRARLSPASWMSGIRRFVTVWNVTERRRGEASTPGDSPVRAAARRVYKTRGFWRTYRSSLCCRDFLYVFTSTVGNKFDIPSSIPALHDHQYGRGVRAHGAGLDPSPAHMDAKKSPCIIWSGDELN